MKLNLKNFDFRKIFLPVQLIFIFFWAEFLLDTYSYFSPYLCCAILSAVCLCLRYRRNDRWKISRIVILSAVSLLFSIAVTLANYALYLPLTENQFRIAAVFLGGIVVAWNVLAYFAKTFPVLSRGFEIETEMTVHAIDKNMQLETVIINYKDRPAGSVSKLNTVMDGMKVLGVIFRLWKNYKPFHFFSTLALVLILVAAGFFIPLVLVPFLQTGLVERIPTLVACGFAFLTAIVSFFSGLILDSSVQKEKREFEFRRQVLSNEKDSLSDR